MLLNVEECSNIYYRNEKIILLKYQEEINYDINDFSYDEERIEMTNSQVLSACNIFDK